MKLSKIVEEIKSKIKVDFKTRKIYIGGRQAVGEFSLYDRELEGKKYSTLSKIEIYPEFRGNGYFEEAMKQITEYADKNNLILILTAAGDFGASAYRLRKFYQKHGFVFNKGRHKDFKHRESMHRYPKITESAEQQNVQRKEFSEKEKKILQKIGFYESTTTFCSMLRDLGYGAQEVTTKYINGYQQRIIGYYSQDTRDFVNTFEELLQLVSKTSEDASQKFREEPRISNL
jgi:GNAT superfamily N-acetyltransferase